VDLQLRHQGVEVAHDEDHRTSLSTGRGVAILLLLCGVQFLDVVDMMITNTALPSIQRELHFSHQSLQWIVSGYVLTYGGFLLLGGRAADLLGRRRVLVAGLAVFATSSLTAGLATTPTLMVCARLVQGIGAAMLSPAALSILTTTFTVEKDRNRAFGVWGAVSGLGAAVGLIAGGVLSDGPGWRYVFFVNIPLVALALAGSILLLSRDARRARFADFDVAGALLATGGMTLGVYSIIEAPDVGWSAIRTVGGLVTAAALLIAFVVNETRVSKPLIPLSIFRVRGLAAADATQLLAFAGIFSMFFFLTLYMQDVLHWSPIRAGVAYLPVTGGFAIAAGLSSQLFVRIGTRPVVVVGAIVAAGGLFYLSRLPVDSSYAADLLPGLLLLSIGAGGVIIGVTASANSGIDADRAGLAAGLLNTSQQLGAALGLAILSAVATAHTTDLTRTHPDASYAPIALTEGFQRGLFVGGLFVLAGAVLALRAMSTRSAALVPAVPPVTLETARTDRVNA
jgi:EmrB/QacA subfamily drug resistance transporter